MIQIKAADIRLVKTCEGFPEQYDAYDPSGNLVGYLRLRCGCFTVECPDACEEEVYRDDEADGWGAFFSEDERLRPLDRAKEAIAMWCNKNPGVYGDISDDPHHTPAN